MEDYFGCNLVGEMDILRIIDEFNLFCNRPYSGSTYFFIEAQLKKRKIFKFSFFSCASIKNTLK